MFKNLIHNYLISPNCIIFIAGQFLWYKDNYSYLNIVRKLKMKTIKIQPSNLKAIKIYSLSKFWREKVDYEMRNSKKLVWM